MSVDLALLIVLAAAFVSYVLFREHQAPSGRPDIVGVASVIDGDTIVIHGTHLRLSGIDAPESAQFCENGKGERYACWQQAAFFMSDMLGQGTVTCHDQGPDKYKRTLARCFLGSGDIQAEMVRNGWARSRIAATASTMRATRMKRMLRNSGSGPVRLSNRSVGVTTKR